MRDKLILLGVYFAIFVASVSFFLITDRYLWIN